MVILAGSILLLTSLAVATALVEKRTVTEQGAAGGDPNQVLDWCFWCTTLSSSSTYCGRKNSTLYAITRMAKPGVGIPEGGGELYSYGPTNSCNYPGQDVTGDGKANANDAFSLYPVSCAYVQRDQYYSEQGAATYKTNSDKNCDYCDMITQTVWDGNNLTVEARAISELPKITYSGGYAQINLAESALRFKFDLTVAETDHLSKEVISSCSVFGGTDQTWAVLGHDPRLKKIRCEARARFENLPAGNFKAVVSVKNPLVSDDTWTTKTSCQKDVTYTISTPTKTRTPTPTATRTPTRTTTPPTSLTCEGLSLPPMQGNPVQGTSMYFTCHAAGSSPGYFNFRHRLNGGEWNYFSSNVPPLALDSMSGQSEEIMVSAGSNEIQCQVCRGTFCTGWSANCQGVVNIGISTPTKTRTPTPYRTRTPTPKLSCASFRVYTKKDWKSTTCDGCNKRIDSCDHNWDQRYSYRITYSDGRVVNGNLSYSSANSYSRVRLDMRNSSYADVRLTMGWIGTSPPWYRLTASPKTLRVYRGYEGVFKNLICLKSMCPDCTANGSLSGSAYFYTYKLTSCP